VSRTLAQAIGSEAESDAARFLEKKGLAIVARNYRTRFGEIDLVAREGETLVFVEVRLRSDGRFGGGAESVGPAKRRRIVSAALHYLAGVRPEPRCRFDVVTLDRGEPEWLRGAFDVVEGRAGNR